MESRSRTVVLGLLTLSGLYVGVWATGWPRGFYDTFPGFHRVWVAVDGPYNEHLVRDVGGLYLGLAVAGCVALVLRQQAAYLVLGAAWTVFSIPHLAYHATHLDEYDDLVDKVLNVVALGATLLLSAFLLLPSRRRATR